MAIALMTIIYLIFKIYITISYFPVMLAAIQKKNEVDSEDNGQNHMVTVSTNWLPSEKIDRYIITHVNEFSPIFHKILLPQKPR